MIIARAGIRLALLAISAATPAAQLSAEEERGWTCQRDFRELGGVLWIDNELDPHGRHVAYTVGYRASSDAGEETDLFWIVPPSGEWFRGLDHASLTFTFPSTPQQGPVAGHLYEDDVLVATQTLMQEKWVRRFRRQPRVSGTLYFNTPTATVQLRIHGTSALVATATGPDGRVLARPRFQLPDWARTDRLVADAIPALDRDALDYKDRCGQQGGEEM